MRNVFSLALLIGLSLMGVVAIPLAHAEDRWTQFRGPQGTGIGTTKAVPTQFGAEKNVRWKTAIHDKGWSSPVVLDKQVWLTTATATGTKQWAVALDLDTGKVLHDVLLFENAKPPYTFLPDANSHASPTPVIEPGRVYVHFGSIGTACLDTQTGKEVWRNTELKCNHWRAPGSSPILWKDLLLVALDGYDVQFVVAFDKKTGKIAWKTPRSIDYKTTNGDLKKAYSTCTVIDVDGKAQLISSTAGGTVAYDPQDGKELWKVEYAGMNAATPPLYAHGLVYLTSGHTAKLYAVDPRGKGNVSETHVRWSIGSAPSRPAPVIAGDLLFLVNDGGIATGHDAKTGKEVWRRRLTGKNFYSSPVLAGGHLYVCSRDGNCHVLTADREGKLVGTNTLEGGIEATPAVVGQSLLIRTSKYLYRIEQR
jgi:outer membrane protein assembly factor BamB